jgi:hypothetical protein
VQLRCGVEALNDVGCFDPEIRVRAQEQARVVVEHVEDLDHLATGQLEGGDVRLPQLVGQLRFKADQRGAWTLLRLGNDQPLTPENAPDRREGGNLLLALSEVIGDRPAPAS